VRIRLLGRWGARAPPSLPARIFHLKSNWLILGSKLPGGLLPVQAIDSRLWPARAVDFGETFWLAVHLAANQTLGLRQVKLRPRLQHRGGFLRKRSVRSGVPTRWSSRISVHHIYGASVTTS